MEKNIRKKLIITADDFGISRKANLQILKLVKLGKIDRVAVIAHGVFNSQEIIELVNSGTKIDIHLNATEKISGKRKMKEGAIKEGLTFLLNLASGKIGKKKVFNDWDRDIKLFIEKIGRIPDGINSHQHVHFFPPFFKIALKLKENYQIPFIRFGRRAILGSSKIKYILSVLRIKNSREFFESKTESSEYLASLDWISDINDLLSNLPEGKTEIVCHPEREEEYQLIKTMF